MAICRKSLSSLNNTKKEINLPFLAKFKGQAGDVYVLYHIKEDNKVRGVAIYSENFTIQVGSKMTEYDHIIDDASLYEILKEPLILENV